MSSGSNCSISNYFLYIRHLVERSVSFQKPIRLNNRSQRNTHKLTYNGRITFRFQNTNTNSWEMRTQRRLTKREEFSCLTAPTLFPFYFLYQNLNIRVVIISILIKAFLIFLYIFFLYFFIYLVNIPSFEGF